MHQQSRFHHDHVGKLPQRALRSGKKALGLEHPDVAVSLNNLAGLYRAQVQYAKSEPLDQRELTIWKRPWGQSTPNRTLAQWNRP